LHEVVHIIAWSYHWSINEIVEQCTVLDLIAFTRLIHKQQLQDDLRQIAIVSNPHTKEPNKLPRKLQQQLNDLRPKEVSQEKSKADLDRLASQYGKKKK
jgi:hypothetical protein